MFLPTEMFTGIPQRRGKNSTTIFHGGRTHLLKIRVGFYTGEG
jgi:hypothetical protein